MQPATVAVAAAVLAFLLALQSHWPRAPGPLLTILGATAAAAAFGLASHGVAVVGPIPAALPVPGLPGLHPGVLRELLLPAFTVLIVGFSDDVLTARSFARRGEMIAANRELLMPWHVCNSPGHGWADAHNLGGDHYPMPWRQELGWQVPCCARVPAEGPLGG